MWLDLSPDCPLQTAPLSVGTTQGLQLRRHGAGGRGRAGRDVNEGQIENLLRGSWGQHGVCLGSKGTPQADL